MKNKEFYKDKIVEIVMRGSGVAKTNNKIVACIDITCEKCDWFCEHGCQIDMIKEWGEKEYVEGKDNPFELQSGDVFYCVDHDGKVEPTYFQANSNSDILTVKFGNACKDEEYMKQRAKEIRLYNLLSNFAYEVNEGWEPDWESAYQNKWYIYQSHSSHGWGVTSYNQIQCMNEVYFKTEELAQKAIEEIIIPFERGDKDDTN